MTDEETLFFASRPGTLALYQVLRDRVLARTGDDTRIKVQKTQITFFNRHGFAFVSFLPCRPKAARPEVWLTLSFGLRRRLDSRRIDAAAEPYPERWTHHILLSDPAQIDGELLDWIEEAAVFAAKK